MRRLAHLIAIGAGRLSRLAGKGGGTSLPGMVLLRMRPRAAQELATSLDRGSVAISATNGKTTTARFVRSILGTTGWRVVANSAGANLLTGVTAALLEDRGRAEIGLFEVDEAALPGVVDQVGPNVIVLMNLFRDQLDRYGELDSLVAIWRSMIAGLDDETVLVVNADDPTIAFLASGRPRVVSFGIEDAGVGRAEISHAADGTHCPACTAPLTYTLITIGHQGHWRCDSCGLTRMPPDLRAEAITMDALRGSTLTVATGSTVQGAGTTHDLTVQLPGLHNVYNALAAAAVAHTLGIDPVTAAHAIGSTDAAFGRAEQVEIDGRRVVLLLAKNPAGANENIATMLLETEPVHVLVMLNDRTADGRDVSWIWDVDYEPMFDRVAHLTVSGERAEDLALRMRYGGLDRSRINIERDPERAIDDLVSATPSGSTAYVLPTYTALLDLRAVLVRRGAVQNFWLE